MPKKKLPQVKYRKQKLKKIRAFVAHYVKSGELHHLSYVIISDCLHHDTVAVHLFQKHFIEYLKKQFCSLPRKFFYASDGAASQYKNRKNFINLCHHEEEFGVAAEWHFSATSHGKGACDGVGGTVKRLAARVSLQRPYDQQITKVYSSSAISKIERVTVQEGDLVLE